jgi:hypothetical protein
MAHFAQLAVAHASADRTTRRRIVNLGAYVRDTGATVLTAKAVDLSTDGCRLIGVSLEPGTTVWLKLSGITPRPARVAWSRDNEAGCEFEEPIAEQIVEELATISAATARANAAKARDNFRRD